MEGKLSVEKGKDGFIFIVFTVKQREDVNECLKDMKVVFYVMKK